MINFDTTFLDYPSPDDIAVVCIMSGCEHHCKGCQNLLLQKICTRSEEEIGSVIAELSELCERNETNKIVLSGGDPLHPNNRNLTKQICFYLGQEGEGKDICIYTGYEINEVREMGLSGFKFIKCGKFDYDNQQKSEKTDDFIQLVNKTQNFFDSNYNQISREGRYYFNNGEKHD